MTKKWEELTLKEKYDKITTLKSGKNGPVKIVMGNKYKITLPKEIKFLSNVGTVFSKISNYKFKLILFL